MKFLDHQFSLSILFIVIINLIKFDLCKCAKEDLTSSDGTVKCGGRFSGHQYLITSPNYPKNYSKNLDCVYDLIGVDKAVKCNTKQEFHLQFLNFEIEESNNCSRDHVRIGKENFYCGNIIGIRRFKCDDDNNNSLKIVFHSDGNNVTAKGFEILVSTIPCTDRANPSEILITESAESNPVNSKSVNDESAIFHPIYHPQAEFDEEENGEGVSIDDRRDDDQSANVFASKKLHKIFSKLPEGLKRPAERLELPIFGQQHFHDKKCADQHENIGIPQPVSPPKISSYLYLPPNNPDSENLKISPPATTRNSSHESAIDRFVVGQPESLRQNAEHPTEFLVLPNRYNPNSPVFLQTKTKPQPQPQPPKEFRETPNLGWLTYGTPDSLAPVPALLPTNGNFDPFATGSPLSPSNCNVNGNTNTNDWRIPSSDGMNWKENKNTPNYFNRPIYPSVIENSGNGNGNGNGNTEFNFEDYDPSFGVNNNNNNNFANYYPSDTNYGIDESTFDIFGGGGAADSARQECCSGSVYSSQNFLIASPGFPSLIQSSRSYECRYTIQRSSQTVCRLNLYLKFFNFGSEDRFCAYGYLEIDGERYCGCKTGANLTTTFDNIATKTISLKYSGYPRGKFAGFLLEVSQESCSTDNYLPFGESFFLRQHTGNQRRNPIFGRQLSAENNFQNIIRRHKRDVGYYYRTPSMPSENRLPIFGGSCKIFKFLNWVKAAKKVWLNGAQCSTSSSFNGQINSGSFIPPSTTTTTTISVIPVFPENADYLLFGNPSNRNCELINVVEGTISSLNYPTGYTNDTSQCFRFAKAPGYCQLELAMLDFDLENSTFCRKDYVSFAGLKRRYCGNSLTGSRTIFDFTRSSYAEIYFVTDSSGSGRGFRAGFSQISCSG